MALNLNETVVEFLKVHPNQYYTARELAEEILKEKPEECQKKMARSKATVTPIDNENALLGQIASEIGAYKQRLFSLSDNKVKITTERPRKYYYSNKTDIEEIEDSEKQSLSSANEQNQQSSHLPRTNGHPEHDSYPLLCQYLYSELNIYPKRIDEKKSSNSKGSNGNKWLYPDIVGLKNLSENWSQDVIMCASKHAFNKTSLWSFEVKIKINLSNVRECFFQTVSNSTWANNSYLVAQEIDDKALDELRILCAGHNIGVILLNKDNPSESQILIPAIEKTQLDWNMINRIANENSDFRNFISLITEFYQTGRIKEHEWDIPKNQA
jgi:hypothetical protein